jgi:hypothetical protein
MLAERLIASIAYDPDSTREIDPGQVLTFGRSEACDLAVGTQDSSVSRVAGEVRFDGATWEVVNRSSTRPLYRLDDTGLRAAIPVGAGVALVEAVTNIAIVGAIRTHVVTLELATPRAERPITSPAPGEATMRPTFTPNEFEAIVALLEGYLHEVPRYEPRPRTYAEAAERLGVPAATVRKRIENVREKLVASGVEELRQPDARLALAEFLLSTRIVRPSDLTVLDRGTAP